MTRLTLSLIVLLLFCKLQGQSRTELEISGGWCILNHHEEEWNYTYDYSFGPYAINAGIRKEIGNTRLYSRFGLEYTKYQATTTTFPPAAAASQMEVRQYSRSENRCAILMPRIGLQFQFAKNKIACGIGIDAHLSFGTNKHFSKYIRTEYYEWDSLNNLSADTTVYFDQPMHKEFFRGPWKIGTEINIVVLYQLTQRLAIYGTAYAGISNGSRQQRIDWAAGAGVGVYYCINRREGRVDR